MDQQAGTSRKKREKREKAGYSYIENGSRPSEASSFRGVVPIIQNIEGSVGTDPTTFWVVVVQMLQNPRFSELFRRPPEKTRFVTVAILSLYMNSQLFHVFRVFSDWCPLADPFSIYE